VSSEGWSLVNEWVKVRRERRGIYTTRINLAIQSDVGTSDAFHRNFQRIGFSYGKQYGQDFQDAEKNLSELLTNVRTSDAKKVR